MRTRPANDNANAHQGGAVHSGGAYDRDSRPPRREYYNDRKSMLHFIDSRRFARAIAGRETTAKPSKANVIAWETGNRLYSIVIDRLQRPEKDLYRLHGLGCCYHDLHRISRRVLIPMIDKGLKERRDYATVPEALIETLTETITERLWREYREIKRVA